ncbi:hypothetical protein OG585_45700 [Streptomyces sp. NBC_01340]|uniref:hypothetical protein n=1 Tax=Streptomyces sp. NBC_01340 TaxID=2903830 RepID=UPI002E0D1985|nr:hypothetical protein OG585_01220 [Streptomyces sp. NBC_01340]WSI44596.1 hypothetical protein OG585_45700 [Streptomyces sp. NBC_01340]
MSRMLTGSSRGIATMLVTLRQASFNSTSDHHAEVIVISVRALRRPQHPRNEDHGTRTLNRADEAIGKGDLTKLHQ